MCFTKNYISFFLLFLVIPTLAFISCADNSIHEETVELNQLDKQKGMHVFGEVDSASLKTLKESNIEWITLVPFADQEKHDSQVLNYYLDDSLNHIETKQYWLRQIHKIHNAGFKVFLKPHIWLYSPEKGKWRSDIFPKNESDWDSWKETYRDFILAFAKIAEQEQVEMFCIGTELTRLTLEKPDFWLDLIQEVKLIYSGELSYAANWYEEYEEISFWNELDYIGVQAYFPLTQKQRPDVLEIEKAWKKHAIKLQRVSKRFKRKILFTELGYKSTYDAASHPWEWLSYTEKDAQRLCYVTQVKCYQGFFNSLWNQEWFAGTHLWQWSTRYKDKQGRENMDFTPQYKPALKVITEGFK